MTEVSVDAFEEFLKISKLERKEYQIEGIKWMLQREEDTTHKGGILADEMGLGKTIQVLGTILCSRMNKLLSGSVSGKTLIVLPVTLLEQWQKTIYYFTGHKPVMFHGVNRPSDLSNSLLVLTTYHLIHCPEIKSMDWERIVFDEAHHLRNPKAKVNEHVGNLKTKVTWLITGTPIQNKSRDIITLFERLGIENVKIVDIPSLCDKYLLKRTKEEVGIKLPGISYHKIDIEWNTSGKEKELASTLHSGLAFNVPIQSNNDSFKNWVYSLSDKCKLPLYTKAKQLCVMPSLMSVNNNSLSEEDCCEVYDNIQNTDKLDMVVNYVLKTSSTTKKMIFCNFRKEMDYIKQVCKEQERSVEIIDGRTSYNKKSYIFSELPEILILQVYTCCEGLNLQEYKHIYFASPQWNPSIEDQAIARCYRVGQTEEVHIYHFKMSEFSDKTRSLESYICDIQEEKRKLYI